MPIFLSFTSDSLFNFNVNIMHYVCVQNGKRQEGRNQELGYKRYSLKDLSSPEVFIMNDAAVDCSPAR